MSPGKLGDVLLTFRQHWGSDDTPPPSLALPIRSVPACWPTHRPPHSSAVVSSTAASTAPPHFAIWQRSASPPERTAPVTAAAICPPFADPQQFALTARGVLARYQPKGRGKMACRAIALRVACIGSQLACSDGAYAGNGHQSTGQRIGLGLRSIWLSSPAINSAR